jgi:TatD DNase family protein
MLIDSHCHLQFQVYSEDRKEVIEKCLSKDMFLNIVGTQKDTSKKAVDLASAYENFYATVGVHPIQHTATAVIEENTSFISRGEEFDEDFFDDLIATGQVIGIGETGLDKYHIPEGEAGNIAFEKQKILFKKHIAFASKHNLPLIVHVRDAKNAEESSTHEDVFEILEEEWKENGNIKGVLHCFTGNIEQAKRYIDLGFYLGFGGVITYPNKGNKYVNGSLADVIDSIPLEKILTETDAPYLSPQKYRGGRCEPWMVEEVVDFIAERKEMDVDKLNDIIENNFRELFSLSLL